MQPSHFTFRAGVCLVGLIWLASVGVVAATDESRSLFVEGYTGRVSYAPGEEVTLHVSTSAAKFAVEITRLGAKPESVWTVASVEGREHPVPEDASSHGCRWPAAVKLRIPLEWRSGYYHATLRARDGGGKFSQRNTRTAKGIASSCRRRALWFSNQRHVCLAIWWQET